VADRGGGHGRELSIDQHDADHDPHTISVWLTVQGSRSISELTAELAEINGVLTVASDDGNVPQA
jgi:putative Mg2+ transporter-C (MgtC) family protein